MLMLWPQIPVLKMLVALVDRMGRSQAVRKGFQECLAMSKNSRES
jgi:hypothetical protein